MHVVRDPAQLPSLVGDRLQHAIQQRLGADHVSSEGLVDRRIKGDVAGAVHHDVKIGRQLRDIGQVALDDLNSGVQKLRCTPGRLPKIVEDRLFDNGDHPVLGTGRALAPDEYRRASIGKFGQDLPQQLLADEPCHAGHHDLLPGQQVPKPAIEPLNGAAGVGGRGGHVSLLPVVLSSCAATRASSMVKRPT